MLSAITDTFSYFWSAYVALALGVVYFVSARAGTPAGRRILAAAYAPVAAGLYLVATFFEGDFWSFRGVPLFAVAQIIPLALFIASIRCYTGPRWLGVVLALLALVGWGWQILWGYLGLYGG